MADDILEVVTEKRIQDVVEWMFAGDSKKDACEKVGISTKTFDRFIASHADFTSQIQSLERSRFADRLEQLAEARLKNLDVKLAFSETLRELAQNPLTDIDTASEAISLLDKLDKSFERVTDRILPAVKEDKKRKPPEIEDNRALALLSQLQEGAKTVTITQTVQIDNQSPSSTGEDVVEGSEVQDANSTSETNGQ